MTDIIFFFNKKLFCNLFYVSLNNVNSTFFPFYIQCIMRKWQTYAHFKKINIKINIKINLIKINNLNKYQNKIKYENYILVNKKVDGEYKIILGKC